jgi:hypothetical protein
VERSKPRVGHGGQTDLTELHCDGLLKFKSGSDETLHLGVRAYPISNLVNSPKMDAPHCIEPKRIDRDFFERQ